MIQVRDLTKDYVTTRRREGVRGGLADFFRPRRTVVRAVDRVSFAIEAGEMVGYIGANGAGKSTTIKMLTGILTPTAGEVRVGGLVPHRERQRYTRHIGVVFGQRTQLWWDLAVVESFRLLKKIYEVDDALYAEQLALFDELLGVGELLHQPVRKLSLGQRMRCDLAAALLHRPRILFLDEPTIGLDAVSKLAVRRFIKTVNAERKLTVILTTHDQNDIEALTDRVILIGKGRILHNGSMGDIKRKFDTYRTLTVTFSPHETPVALPHADLISWRGERAVYRLDTAETTVSAAVGALGKTLNILDMTSESPPVEEIIAGLYREHGI